MSNGCLTITERIACGLDQSHLVDFQGRQVHGEIVADLNSLVEAAKKAGFTFAIASSYRGFERQMQIWNAKFASKRPVYDLSGDQVDLSSLDELAKIHAIMLFSALPGASRHHFGSDLDVFASNCIPTGQNLQLEPWEYQDSGYLYEFNRWLDNNLARFGFYRPYDEYRQGVAPEPWHISHRATASKLTPVQSVTAIANVIREHDVQGKDCILAHLPELYERFIINVA